jgi:hypothetical protein
MTSTPKRRPASDRGSFPVCPVCPASFDRSFVQWQGRGPTNRRRGFDSLSSDRRHEPPYVRLSRSIPDRAASWREPMVGTRAAHFVRGVHFLPRSVAVSRPLKPVMLVRFQLGERASRCGGRGVLECTPRCERGGAGSIPAGHPTTGCGSMAGHLARNQVHAGSIPAAQTEQGTSSNGRTRRSHR